MHKYNQFKFVHNVLFSVQYLSIVCPVSSHLTSIRDFTLTLQTSNMSVKSKNLFNFPAQGSYDEDVAAFMVQQKLMMKEMFGEESPLLK